MASMLKYTLSSNLKHVKLGVLKNDVKSLINARMAFQDHGHHPFNFSTSAATAQDEHSLCENVESQSIQFSRSRARDISGNTLAALDHHDQPNDSCNYSAAVEASEIEAVDKMEDEHVSNYDAQGSINLSSVMQTNVPEPFSTQGKRSPTHLNMPGGHIGQGQKYLSDHLHNTHSYKNVQEYHTDSGMFFGGGKTFWCCNATSRLSIYPFAVTAVSPIALTGVVPFRRYGQNSKEQSSPSSPLDKKPIDSTHNLSSKQKLKRAVKEYGSTVIVFHVTISLMSLGAFYLAVSSGIDVMGILTKIGLSQSLVENKLAAGASTFVVAYAVHKIFAPARIAVTLTSTPFIVRYLRQRGVLKPPK